MEDNFSTDWGRGEEWFGGGGGGYGSASNNDGEQQTKPHTHFAHSSPPAVQPGS